MAKNDRDPLDSDPVIPPTKSGAPIIRRRPLPPPVSDPSIKPFINDEAAIKKFGYFEGPNKAEANRLDPDDPEKKKMLDKRPAAYVNRQGIVFPQGFKFAGGHICWQGNVVLKTCPKCKMEQSISGAINGVCENHKCGPDLKQACGHSAVAELEEYSLS